MSPEQKAAIDQLAKALKDATDCGALDELMAYVRHPDSINDVCDAVALAREP